MSPIDPTARVDKEAVVGPDVSIGPYCVIGPHVTLGEGCRLVAHVYITGHTTIGARTVIAPFTSLGTPPQSVNYRGGPTRLVIGSACDIRESVTMNTGTEDGGGLTQIGDRSFFMVGSHVGHDCVVGNDVIFANNAGVAGHVSVGDHVFVGGHSAIHQFIRIGEGAMVGGMTGVRENLIPFGFAFGQSAVMVGLNIVGLRRRGASRADLHELRRAYRLMFFGDGQFADRVAAVARDHGNNTRVAKIIDFIREGGSRSLMKPRARRSQEAALADTT